jgi:hypothetical protein
MAYRVMPTTVLTPDDWIAHVRPRKGRPFKVGMSCWLSEAEALACLQNMIEWKGVGTCDVRMKRRHSWGPTVTPSHPENRARFDRHANG